MFRHILPNALTPLLITATFGIAGAVGSESALSFVGLGDPTVASWGMLLEQGRQNIHYAHLIWLPGMAVFILVSALNLIGNGLREAADTTTE
jgi:peptide/nickel transport system permease protein